MTTPASIAFERIVSLVMSGELAPSPLTTGQAAAERAKRLQEERVSLTERLVGAGIRVPQSIAVHELRELAAAVPHTTAAEMPMKGIT